MRHRSRPVQPRPVQPLLFCQTLVLTGVLGAATVLQPALVLLTPLVVLLDSRCRQGARLLMTVLCFTIGLGWAWLWQPALPSGGEPVRGEISGRVLKMEGLYDRRLRITLDDVQVQPVATVTVEKETKVASVEKSVALPGRTTWSLEGFEQTTRPVPGQTVHFTGKVTPITGFRNDGNDGGQRWWARQGIFWRVWSGANTAVRVSEDSVAAFPSVQDTWAAELREALRQKLMMRLQRLYPDLHTPPPYGVASESAPRGSGFVPALLFGDRFFMGATDWNRLGHAGLLHSIALSGQHLAVTGLLAGLLLWLAGRVRPELFLYRPRITLGLWLAVPLAAVYLWLGNAPSSLTRSALMLGCVAVVCTRQRPMLLMDGFVWALGLMVLADPGILADVGAQLSFLAVFGLVLAAPLLQRWRLKMRRHPWLLAGGTLLLCSSIIQISTLPVTLETFGWISPWWLLNLLWLPVLGLWVLPMCVLALAAVALGIGPLADAALVLAVEPCGLLLKGLGLVEPWLGPLWCLRPHWAASAGLLVMLTGTALLWERSRILQKSSRVLTASRLLCGIGLALLLSGPFLRLAEGLSSEVRLRLLDVGQGQAVLLEFPGERRLLVDGGGVRSPRFDTGQHLLAPVLTRNRPPRLNTLILSHPDMDHLRGLLFLAQNFVVGEAVLPAGAVGHETAQGLFADYLRLLRETAIPVRELSAGGELPIGNIVLEVLAPLPGRDLASNDGLVLRLRQGERGLAVLCGDATRSLLGAVVRGGAPLRAEILVAPHHGSRHNMRDDFLRAVAAKEIWVSCAAFNRYGFPADILQEFCTEQGIRLRQTAEEGELNVFWKL